MNYWDAIVQEVLHKEDANYIFSFTNLRSISSSLSSSNTDLNRTSHRRKKMKTYALGESCNDAFFTQREAECMVQLLQGKTINQVGTALNLSPRTVEFYMKNMKSKVNCRTKSELIGKVLNSNFMENDLSEINKK